MRRKKAKIGRMRPHDEQGSEEFRGLGPPLGPDAAGQRADAFLARRFPFHSRRVWAETCRAGELLVNGRPVRAGHRLKTGDLLHVFHPLAKEPEVDERIALVAEAGGVIAVYKPGNLPMHEAGDYRRRTFGALLAKRFGPEWHPVHRLDRETSGLVLCAATPALRRRLSEAWEAQQVEKRYLAVARGVTAWETLAVREAMVLSRRRGRPVYVTAADGLAAHTEFRVLERAGEATLLGARPRTGRTNQIRVHAAWTGHALVGDKIYHDDPRVFAAYCADPDGEAVRALAGFPRQALHATALVVTHPETGRELVAESPLPEDLVGLWASLRSASWDSGEVQHHQMLVPAASPSL